MERVPLATIPNQSFSLQLGANFFDVRFALAGTEILATIVANNTPIITNTRILINTPILPYKHLQTFGNFILLSSSDDLPDYTSFDISQILIYVSPDELASILT